MPRCDWQEARGLPSGRGARDDLGSSCGNPEQGVWVLVEETAGVIGQTTVQEAGPLFGWTDAERSEPAFYPAGSVTDPAAKTLQPGRSGPGGRSTVAPGWACPGSGGTPRSPKWPPATSPRAST